MFLTNHPDMSKTHFRLQVSGAGVYDSVVVVCSSGTVIMFLDFNFTAIPLNTCNTIRLIQEILLLNNHRITITFVPFHKKIVWLYRCVMTCHPIYN